MSRYVPDTTTTVLSSLVISSVEAQDGFDMRVIIVISKEEWIAGILTSHDEEDRAAEAGSSTELPGARHETQSFQTSPWEVGEGEEL